MTQFTENDRRAELVSSALSGVQTFLASKRGTLMFGARSTAELTNGGKIIRVRCYVRPEDNAPTYYEIRVLRPI